MCGNRPFEEKEVIRRLRFQQHQSYKHILDDRRRGFNYFLGSILPLLPTPNATHPAIKQSPPTGVIGPAILPNRCGSRTRRYMLPENIVIPAVNNPAAMRFCGAAVVASRRTPECMSCKTLAMRSQQITAGRWIHLILCCCTPVRKPRGVCDTLLQAMGTEGPKRHACRTVDTPNSPECHDDETLIVRGVRDGRLGL